MNLKNQKKSKLYISLGIVTLTVIGLIIGAYFMFFNKSSSPAQQPQYSPATNTPDISDNTDKQPTDSITNTPREEIPVSNTGSITISNLNQKDGYVNALATVSSFTPSKCVYTFTSDGSKPVTREQQGNCMGISILEDEFDKIGTYTLTVSAYDNGQRITVTKDIYIK